MFCLNIDMPNGIGGQSVQFLFLFLKEHLWMLLIENGHRFALQVKQSSSFNSWEFNMFKCTSVSPTHQ